MKTMDNETMPHDFRDLSPEDVDSILVMTSDGGPWEEDLHYLIVGPKGLWRIPNSDSAEVFPWLERFADVDWQTAVEAATCTENRTFVIWRRFGPPVLLQKSREQLRQRLVRFLELHFQTNEEQRDTIANGIFASYDEPHRHYHNLAHVLHGLWELDAIPQEHQIDRAMIELAIWYHDIVYRPGGKGNEARSVEKLHQDLDGLETSLSLSKVADLILASGDHSRRESIGEEGQYFLDLDLAIMGQAALDYLIYCENVRREYHGLPEVVYHYHRNKLLKRVRQQRIYQTPWFFERYEERARQNIAGELRKWRYLFFSV